MNAARSQTNRVPRSASVETQIHGTMSSFVGITAQHNTHPFPGVASPQFLPCGPPQHPQDTDVHREVETKDPQALEPLEASHPGEASGAGDEETHEDGGPGQRSPPQGGERMREEEGGRLGQAEGVHHAHVQADAQQGEEVAHLLHVEEILQKQQRRHDANTRERG